MKKEPSIEEMIESCRKTQKPTEEIVFALGVGRMIPMIGKKKAFDEALKYIKSLDGFIGVNPVDIWHNLLIFDTLNHAKAGRNGLKAKGVDVGQVAPILVEKQYLGKESAE